MTSTDLALVNVGVSLGFREVEQDLLQIGDSGCRVSIGRVDRHYLVGRLTRS